jgi:SAM-dependent methyltransferase
VGLDRPPVSAPTFWEELYTRGQDGWELGMPAPALGAWLDRGGRFTSPDGRGPARVAVPGAGRGHDARLLARRGYRAWGFDFAGAAVAQARGLAERDGVTVRYEQRDIFTLEPEYRGFFDGVWEYTCFCAIDPRRRGEYARVVHAILKPGGTLLACFYPVRHGEDGPPFPVSQAEIEGLLLPYFCIVESGPPASSVERREGLEWLVRATRRG